MNSIDLAQWYPLLKDELSKEYFKELEQFIDNEYKTKTVYPSKNNIFNAFKLTPPNNLKVVILGQDPYHGKNQAHGLSFSVLPGEKIPPSLRNIYKELKEDIGCPIPKNGFLETWSKEGVLLLNTVLTVEEGKANSHKQRGWELFTDEVIRIINNFNSPVVFILWGNNAISKTKLITNENHCIIRSVHPSPLSASRGFFGTKPFSKANEFLERNNITPINWCI